MAKAAFTLFCFVDTIGIGTTMAPSTVFGHAEYRAGSCKSEASKLEKNKGSVAVKCKKVLHFEMKNFFLLKTSFIQNSIKNFLHLKMSYTSKCKIQNVRVQQHKDLWIAHFLNS